MTMKKVFLFVVYSFIAISSVYPQMKFKGILTELKEIEKQFRGDLFFINRYTYEAEEKFGEVVKKDIQGCKQYGFTKSGKLKWIFIDNDSEQNVRECFYDENDLLTSFVMYTEDKTFNKKSNEKYVLKYNNNKKISEILTLSDSTRLVFEYENGKEKSITEYDKNNNLIEKIVIKHLSNIEYEEILFDKNGQPVKTSRYKNKLLTSIEEGRSLITLKYDANKRLIEQTNSEIAPNGSRATYNGRNIGNSISVVYKHAYNEKGDKVSHKAISHGTNIAHENYQYTYDNKRNWLRKITSFKSYDSSNTKLTFEEQDITYFSTTKSDSIPNAPYLDSFRDYSTDLPNRDAFYKNHRYEGVKSFFLYLQEQDFALPFGEVMVVDFTVYKSGRLRNIEIKQGSSKSVNNKLLNILRKAKFEPAIRNGKFISKKFRIAILQDWIMYPNDVDFTQIQGLHSLK